MDKPDLNVAEFVEQIPDADKPGQASKFTGPDPEAAEKIYSAILAGGRPAIDDLIALVRTPADPDFRNYKAAYVLHGLAVYAGRPGKEKERELLTEVIAANLDRGSHSNEVKKLLVRELQAAGGKEVAGTLAKLLNHPELCEPAAQALLAIRQGAAEHFRSALPAAEGPCRLTIIQALGVLRDASSTDAIQGALTAEDREVRIAAAWALANSGSESSAAALLKKADSAEDWERIQVTKACLLLAEKLVAAGKKEAAGRIYSHFQQTRTDPADAYVRKIADENLGKLR